MNRNLKTMVALCVAAQLLGGCQSLWGSGRIAVRAPEAVAGRTAAVAAGHGEEQLGEGRKALDAGNTVAAITAFRLARMSPASAAAASNGLAVAYSRLGRHDLTERYFREAIVLAPDEPKYHANLARFHGLHPAESIPQAAPTPAMAQAAQAQPAMAAAAAVPAASRAPAARPVALARGVVAWTPQARIQRISRNEVRIGAPANEAAPVRRRLAWVDNAEPRPRYPVRVAIPVMGQPASTAARAPSRSAYPVRVEIGRAAR